jgi:hypothetical protein
LRFSDCPEVCANPVVVELAISAIAITHSFMIISQARKGQRLRIQRSGHCIGCSPKARLRASPQALEAVYEQERQSFLTVAIRQDAFGSGFQITDCVAGVVGLELRNPLGSKSARVAGENSGSLAEIAQQRRFAFKLRRGQRSAAARISAGVGPRKTPY